MKLKYVKQEEAKARQATHDVLTVEQKIAKLDQAFGPGLGAEKERSRLRDSKSQSTKKPTNA